MSDLLNKKCTPCEGGVIPFDISEIHKYQKKVDGWNIIKNNKEIYFLEKNFKFENFHKSQNFVNEVGKISEEEGHHPDINFDLITLNILERAKGVEPSTFSLATRRSTTELCPQFKIKYS